jgi:hypothetical protein
MADAQKEPCRGGPQQELWSPHFQTWSRYRGNSSGVDSAIVRGSWRSQVVT